MEKEEIGFLNQLVNTFEEASVKLKEAHDKKDYDGFLKARKFMKEINGKISGGLK